MQHEDTIALWLNRHLPTPLAAFAMFVIKQAWACLFAGCLLIALIGTKLIWQDDWPLARYDALVLTAISLQILFLWLKLESWTEAKVIAVFHITGTLMEFFKVSAGSWCYPEPGLLKLYDVPLFSGFMYAAVGSYMVRVIRLFNMLFAPFPPMVWHFGLAVAVYINFFSHHFIWDVRVLLFLGTILDTASIILIVVPLFLGLIESMGLSLVWFGIVAVVAAEIGLLTPPLGLSCFVIKATLDDDRIIPHRSDQGGRAIGSRRLELLQDNRQLIGRMFHVHQQPVIADIRHRIRRKPRAQADPQPDLRRPGLKTTLEGVLSHVIHSLIFLCGGLRDAC